jgi:aerobic carbon-monoxide dehydrogenase large subunit
MTPPPPSTSPTLTAEHTTLGLVYVGRRLTRREDPPLVTGRGRYAADVKPEGLCHLALLRSPLAHARIGSVDVSAARELPGVVAVWAAADLGLPDYPESLQLELAPRPRPLLARHEVRYAGEPLALVVAGDRYTAQDAVGAIEAELDPLPALAGVERAAAEGDEHLAGRTELRYGDIEAAFAAGGVLVRGRLKLERVAAAAMEPRQCTAAPDGKGGLTIWTSTQWVFGVRNDVAQVLGLDPQQVRVLAEDVGGGFGAKTRCYPEEILTAAAALRLGRPVSWVGSRSDDTASTTQAHGTVLDLELAAGPDGRLRGLRGHVLQDIGAYTTAGSGSVAVALAHLRSAYRMPAMSVSADLYWTNAIQTGFIRGGGREVGNFAIERMLDKLASELHLDPAEVRRRNLVPAAEMPYDNGGVLYEGGDYEALLDLALERSRYSDARADPKLGVGLACCVESTGMGSEPARVRVEPDGKAHLLLGSSPQGQGHRTMAAMMLADRLGWPIDRIEVTLGDTTAVSFAALTAGSRSAVQVGNATALAGAAMRRALLERAAEVLEADAVDLVLEDGVVSVKGAPARSMDAREVVPPEGLEVSERFEPELPLAWASSCSVAVVSVDPETAGVNLIRYVIAHDSGQPINELTMEGQIHGGLAHGVGYALFEEAIYGDDAAFRSASFLDYTIPSAPEMAFDLQALHTVTLSAHNPEGIRGAGEAAAIPASAAIAAAVEDALRKLGRPAGVDEVPITPERVWRQTGVAAPA